MVLFNTASSIFTDLGVICVAISGVLAVIAHRRILQGRPWLHHLTVISGYIFLVLFLTFYITNFILHGTTFFGGPEVLKLIYYPFLLTHMVTAAVMGGLTTYLVFSGLKRTVYSEPDEWKKFQYEDSYRQRHMKLGRWGFYLWYLTVISGIMVYLLLYVIFEPAKTL